MKSAARASQEGFTLIELLVIVMIIGVLAAIAVPVHTAQRDKAKEAAGSPTKGDFAYAPSSTAVTFGLVGWLAGSSAFVIQPL